MSGSDREDLPDVWEWSGGPPGSPGVVGRTARMSGMVGRTSVMFGIFQEDLRYVREW